MKIKIINKVNKSISIIFIIILLQISCNNTEMKEMKTTHPILKIEIIKVPSSGIVEKLYGEIYLKKKGSNQYLKIYSKDKVDFGDILELRKGSSIKIGFNNRMFLTIEPVEKDSWFSFEKSKEIDSRIKPE